jgi:magnesium chelatase family protein
VEKAREVQLARQGVPNSQLEGEKLKKFCELEESESNFLVDAIDSLGLSARAYHRILRVARTIADLADKRVVGMDQLAEALSFRKFDREV